jgi:hypothetical protein
MQKLDSDKMAHSTMLQLNCRIKRHRDQLERQLQLEEEESERRQQQRASAVAGQTPLAHAMEEAGRWQ